MLAPLLVAQLSLGIGGVRATYAGAPAVDAVQLAPRFDWSQGLDQGFVQGSWAQLEGGGWAGQFSTRESHARRLGQSWVIGSDGSLEASLLQGGIATGTLQEALGAGRRIGRFLLSLGIAGGVLRDTAGTFAPLVSGRIAVGLPFGTLKAQRFDSRLFRYTDLEYAAEAPLGPTRASGGVGLRWHGGDRQVWHLELSWPATRLMSLDAGLGRTPPSPEGFTTGDYYSLGVRLTYAPKVRRPVLTHVPAGTRVELAVAGSSVDIAGDWNDWSPAPMTKGADGTWSAVIPVTSGAHKFSLTVDGKVVVPRGVPRLPDGFGGEVGLLVF